MMDRIKIERCEQVPAGRDLAISYAGRLAVGDRAEPSGLYRGLLSHHDFWEASAHEADDQAHFGRWELSGLHKECGRVLHELEDWGVMGARDRIYLIRRGFSIVALSQLCHLLFGETDDVLDGQSLKRADTIPEYAVEDDRVLDYRLHLPIETANSCFEDPLPDAPEGTWYQENGLFIQRKLKADPAPALFKVFKSKGVKVDFTKLQTLFPFHAQGVPLEIE